MSHKCDPSFLPMLLWGAGSVRAVCGMLMLSGICYWSLMWIQEEVNEAHSLYQIHHEKVIPILQSGLKWSKLCERVKGIENPSSGSCFKDMINTK